ncbi:MAG: hypothetical protein ABSB60_11355 [Terracidiphilus sp.]|jgi:hypothetical protein
MATPQRLSADALASELSKLPLLNAATPSTLTAVRIAIARAVASGQSADELTTALNLPAGWQGIDLSKPPVIALGSAVSNTTPATASIVESAPQTTPLATPPAWIAEIVPLALAKDTVTRIVVLDHEPTALGGLERPSWARALSPAATYGPIAVVSADLKASSSAWIHVFHFTETVEFVRAGTVLCVVPLDIVLFGTPTQASIASGSAWIAVNPFDSSAPAGSFAGITIQSGEITCDQPFSVISGVVNLPASATIDLTLVPAPSPAGPSGFPTNIAAPGKISARFPSGGSPSISFDHCSATLYGEHIHCSASNHPAAYNAALQFLYVPGISTRSTFTPASVSGKLIDLTGMAPIESVGWALSVSASTTPLALGTAVDSGEFAIAFGAGLSSRWTELTRAEFEAGGVLIAQNAALALYLISGSAPGVLIEQRFQLWVDQESTNGRRCQLLAARGAGQILRYALAGSDEVLELGAGLDALVDRPLLASGARVPALFLEGIVALIHNGAGNRLAAYSATPFPEPPGPTGAPAAYPMALDNALLEVSEPLALLLSAKADADFNAIDGGFLLLFGYLLVELYLPDPYTGGLAPGRTDQTPATFAAPTAGGSVAAGYLLAEVGWTKPANATLRLEDTAHTHPAIPPSTEASSTTVPPPEVPIIGPIHFQPIEHSASPTVLAPATGMGEIEEHAVAPPPPGPTPIPLPEPTAGAMLLDLSTRASQLGVEVKTGERQDLEYTIDGLSVRGPAFLLPLSTLPAIAWEPMYNLSTTPDAGVNNFELLHPPGDGPFTQVVAASATLIPISPLQSLQAVLDAGTGGFTAQLTLPFGMVGGLSATADAGTILPELTLVQPTFPAASTPSGTIYTGAWQLSFAAPDPTDPDPVMAGRSYLCTPTDNPTWPALSYGEMVLGTDASGIFNSHFNNPMKGAFSPGVPLRRYDLTGYGASTFSEWTNTTPDSTDVTKVFFHTLIGRTSHEVIQVQSIIDPWAIKVVRTITIDRQASGVVQRYDSGWQPASDGLFAFPASTGITPDQVHAGVISGVINVKNIQQLGLPVNTQGTEDGTGLGTKNPTPINGTCSVQPVTFDADVAIQPQHQVLQGGVKKADLNGVVRVCVPSTGITGFINLESGFHLSVLDMANFGALKSGAGGAINATLNVGGADHLLRATEFDATPVHDTATSGIGIACAVRGMPKLSSDGSWGVAARTQSQAAPIALPPTAAAPVVQPNTGGGTTPGNLIHYANPADIFRLDPSSTTPPETLYGFLQATGTQSNLLSRPMLTVGSQDLTLGDALNVAHAGALLGAISSFPGIAQCLQFLSTDPYFTPIVNQLENATLSTEQNLYLSQSVRETPVPLITTSIASVNLYFYQQGDTLGITPGPSNVDPANVQITLGSPTSPSWSLDVNHLAIGLVIPALSSKPVIWFQGSFHADADSLPAFPNLSTAFDDPLNALETLFTVLNDIASVLSPGGGSSPEVLHAHDSGTDNPGLNVSFSDGKLSVSDDFTLPSIPLGLGTIENISLDINATLDILGLNIDFLVGIGSPDAPCQWIVDPLTGTLCVQAGIQNNGMDVLVQAGIGLGLSIDLGIASGSASIVIAVQLQINGVTGGAVITVLLLLTGQAQVDVLGGLASAAITLTAGLGFSIDTAPPPDINLIGTASVGIHISICWVINISWSGSWTFQKQLPFNPLLP